jgi:hypothetical protein
MFVAMTQVAAACGQAKQQEEGTHLEAFIRMLLCAMCPFFWLHLAFHFFRPTFPFVK